MAATRTAIPTAATPRRRTSPEASPPTRRWRFFPESPEPPELPEIPESPALAPDVLRQAKVFGFSDREIAEAIGSDEMTVRNSRIALGIRPAFGEVDTCAGEFEAKTPY